MISINFLKSAHKLFRIIIKDLEIKKYFETDLNNYLMQVIIALNPIKYNFVT